MRSFISWVGGKNLLAGEIIPLFPAHKTYVEVFGGAGWVLFKKEPSGVEVYNDLNGELVNLFRVVKRRPANFYERLNLLLYSRQSYYDFKNEKSEGGDEMDRAVRFYYLIKASFGSTIGGGWGFSKIKGPKPFTDQEILSRASERLKKVYIDNRSFERVFEIYDSLETLFYLDPPYTVTQGRLYQHDFCEEDHRRLREAVDRLKGKFIMSYDDSQMVRGLYKEFRIHKTKPVRYSIHNRAGAKTRKQTEILIANF